MKILAFAATSSKHSINRQLITYATQILDDTMGTDVTVETIDLNDYEMPIYSIDRQNEGGIPQLAHDFFDKIGQADAVLISFAEHNGFYTAAYKNLFDWTSRIDMAVYQNKPTVMLSTSPGPSGGGNALRTAVESAVFFGNDVVANLSIPTFYDNFDADTQALTNPDLDAQLRASLASFSTTREGAIA
jgi:NAD(P)H-dependent FMN reductase